MMNIQNPASYPPQQTYTGYGNAMAQPGMQPPAYPNDLSQNQFQQSFPQSNQRPNQFPQQPGSQIPPHVYQQLQQQQQTFAGPQSRGSNGMITGQQGQSPSNTPGSNQNPDQALHNTPTQIPTSAPQTAIKMAMAVQLQQAMASNPALAQQMQMQNAAQQMNRPMQSQQAQQAQQIPNQASHLSSSTPVSPQSATREKARVTVLLDINSLLLQEVIALQNQGKAGPVTQPPNNPNQQSPTSPSSAAPDSTNTFSPTDTTPPAKATGPPSKEYSECMRRLQANLSYLAAIADAKKRPDGKVPPYPAIISPPPHLEEVHELYRKLAMLFPEASQSKTNQAIAFASAQHQQAGQGGTQ